MTRMLYILGLTGICAPQAALAVPAVSQVCSVVDATGANRDVQFSFDSLSEIRKIGFSYPTPADVMPLPQKATYLAYKPGEATFIVDTDKGKFELSVSRIDQGPVEIVLAPYAGAKPDAGFVGFCFSSPAAAPALLETSVEATDPNDRPFFGWTKITTDLQRVCRFIRSDRRYVDGHLKIAAQTEDGIAFPISVEAGGIAREGKIANLANSGEGDHHLITGLFYAGQKNTTVVGAVKNRGPVDWIYLHPGKDSTSNVSAQGICLSRSVEGQATE